MRLPRLILASVALAFPIAAFAMTETLWDFRGTIPDGMEGQGVVHSSVEEDGLHMTTGPEGAAISLKGGINPKTTVVTIRVRVNRPTKGYFIWHVQGRAQEDVPQLPFDVPPSPTMQEINLVMRWYPQWEGTKDLIGIGFQEGTEVVLESVSFRSWSFDEQLIEMTKGFWRFDEFRPYSINFLWGPLLPPDPASLAVLYDSLPPRSHSATHVMYALLGLALLGFIITFFAVPAKKAKAFSILCLLFVGLWLLFDLRMGSELITYAIRDIHSFALKPVGERTLRTHEQIFDTLDLALPELQKHPRFGLVTDENGFYSLIRYRSYPSLPITPDKAQSGITLWLVAYRPDAKVDAQGKLVVGGKVLAGSGKIQMLNEDSFLFSTQP